MAEFNLRQDLSATERSQLRDELEESILQTVRRNLTDMKHQLVESIISEVISQTEATYTTRLQQLEKRLEDEMSRKLEELEHRYVASASSGTDKCSGTANRGERIDIENLHEYGYELCRYNGWIFYSNDDMADFLYKVRDDGTCNTQLTDYAVSTVAYVSEGYLYFYPFADSTKKKIKL